MWFFRFFFGWVFWVSFFIAYPVRRAEQVAAVMAAKRREIAAGVAGFLVYDLALVEPARRLWAESASAPSLPSCDVITADDLLTLPKEKERKLVFVFTA